jgi:CubicO group peptidase (beta-lactamase class C family)
MSEQTLSEFLATTATQFQVPGVAVGVWAGGREYLAAHGVTSVANSLPVDGHTVFEAGSISKTFTASVVMRLVADGAIDLDVPVRRYVPELTLADEAAAAQMTVRHLLNHTAGLGWRLVVETGDGDNALAEYVARMAELEQIGPVGGRSSYSQSGYNLLGRIVEKATGLTFEQAVTDLLLTPIGLSETHYHLNDIMVGRFAVGHNVDDNGTPVISSQWKDNRANNPGGGIAASASDLLRWARFHLGDGRDAAGEQVLPTGTLHLMQQPTVELQGSALGDAVGLCWFIKDVAGTTTVGHGGSGHGQFAELLLVPERDFAVVVMSNASPDGIPLNQAVVKWTMEHFLGVIDRDPEPLPYDPERAREIAGAYEVDVMTLTIRADETGQTIEVQLKPGIRASLGAEAPADYPPFDFGMLPGDGGEYIVTNGAMKSQRGFFTRDEAGRVIGVDLAGRLFGRVTA